MRKKILVLFVNDCHASTFGAQRDVFRFLLTMPEVKLIADYECDVISLTGGANGWGGLIRAIYSGYIGYSGVVVFADVRSVLFLSGLSSFVFRGIEKPIVFTCSRNNLLSQSIDARSNIINSFQLVASSTPLNEVALVFGSRVLRPTRAFFSDDPVYNLFSASPDGFLGRIDFGFTPVNPESRSSNPKLMYMPVINDRVAYLHLYPFVNIRSLNPEFDGTLIVGGEIDKKNIQLIHCVCKNVVLLNVIGHGNCSDCVNIEGAQVEAVVSKLMWSLGQSPTFIDFKSIFKANLIGEWGTCL